MNQISSSAPPAVVGSSRWTAGRITSVVAGSLIALVAIGLVGAGGWALWADRSQRDGGYVTPSSHQFDTAGSAITTKPTHFGSAGTGWLYAPGLLGKVRIRVTPTASTPLFVGIGPSDAVDNYLTGVAHTVINDYWSDKTETVSGGQSAAAPASQHFWAASTSGSGQQTLTWKPQNGSWTVVVMKADGSPGVNVKADLGAQLSALPWIALGLLIAGAVFMAGGVLLIVGAIPRDNTKPATAAVN